MTAHPVKMIGIERSLAQDGESDLEQPRHQPAPGREHQQWPAAQPARGWILRPRARRAGLLADSSPAHDRRGSLVSGIPGGGDCIVPWHGSGVKAAGTRFRLPRAARRGHTGWSRPMVATWATRGTGEIVMSHAVRRWRPWLLLIVLTGGVLWGGWRWSG